MKSVKTNSTFIKIGLILFVTLFVFFLYTFLHESGHAIAGLIFGQSLTAFDVSFWDLSAHVGMVGGNLTDSQLAIQALAGAILPPLFWVIFISLAPIKANFLVETLKLISSMAVINSLLAWIILPLLFLLGHAPTDDVTNFLRYSEMPPLLLAFTAFLLYAGGWVLFLSKIKGLRNELQQFHIVDPAKLIFGTNRTIPLMTGILAVAAILSFTLNRVASANPLNRFLPPRDFSPIAQIDLSKQAYTVESLTKFSLDEPADVAIFVAIRDIDTTYFDLYITGSNGFRSIIMHGEEYRADQDGGLWQERLPAGSYQVLLTSHRSPGTTTVYMKIH